MSKGRHAMVTNTSRQSGFGLFEILITMVITAIGLLGLAAMQATGLKNNHSAYNSSQATLLAYAIADSMRANTAAINNYLSSYMTLEQAETAGAQAGCYTTAGCTAAQMAQNDLFEWNAALQDALPSATGSITLAGDIYTVTVNWDDNRDGVVDGDDPNFQFSFEP